jgi:hypothetical protein
MQSLISHSSCTSMLLHPRIYQTHSPVLAQSSRKGAKVGGIYPSSLHGPTMLSFSFGTVNHRQRPPPGKREDRNLRLVPQPALLPRLHQALPNHHHPNQQHRRSLQAQAVQHPPHLPHQHHQRRRPTGAHKHLVKKHRRCGIKGVYLLVRVLCARI